MGNVLDQFLPIFIKIRYVLQGSKVDLSDGYILDSVLDDLRMVEWLKISQNYPEYILRSIHMNKTPSGSLLSSKTPLPDLEDG